MALAEQNHAQDISEVVVGGGGYVLAMTTKSTDKGPIKPGAINGGFFEKTNENNLPSVAIQVEDVEKSMKDIKKNGGKVLSKPQEIPGVGLWAVFRDTEGNRVSILQAPDHSK